MITINPVTNAIVQYVSILNNIENGQSGYQFTIEPGRKFVKIVQSYKGSGRSVHAFVNIANGDVYKPASWKAPMKDTRYNLLTDMPTVARVCDPYGSYLYKDFVKKI